MESWLAQYFIHPAIATGGAFLLSAPIIIHLINRLRFKRVRFAAMEFLLQSEQRNRRRILIEQLLLLLMRLLIVAGIVSLISRLILNPEQLSIFQGAKTHHVVLLDDSGSMRDRLGETTAFDLARKMIQQLITEGAQRPETQQFSLILLSAPDAPVFVQQDINSAFVQEFETRLENLVCSHQSLDLADGISACRQLLSEDKGMTKNVHILSDFRQPDWLDQKATTSSLQELDDADVTVNLLKIVPERHANLSITELSGALQIAAVGIPLRLKVGVKNHGDKTVQDVGLSVLADGRKLPLSIVFEKLEPESEVSREFDVVFPTAGAHKLRVQLDGDALAEDNVRYLAIDVHQTNPVLIIDGNAVDEESFFLTTALSPGPQTTGYSVTIESPDALRRIPLDGYQSIIMINVSEIAPDAVALLEDYVRNGGGLGWFLGDAIKPRFYNDVLCWPASGLFPVRIEAAPQLLSRDELSNEPDLVLTDNPIFSVFRGQDNPLIEGVNIYRYFSTIKVETPVENSEDVAAADEKARPVVETIARLRNGAPLMFEHRFGAGRVVTSLTSAGPLLGSDDIEWNDWARNPSYIVAMLELQKRIARSNRQWEIRDVGEPITVTVDPALYSDTVEIIGPEATGQRLTPVQALPLLTERDSSEPASSTPVMLETPSYEQTDIPGIYGIRLTMHGQNPEEQFIAYNFPEHESELALASSGEIRQMLGDGSRVQIHEPGDFQWIQGKEAGQEVRNAILIDL
ncbi:MAG: BatA domain-containing protein, partial [Planctomycetota bacterium]|nr:BatA domain-containing protein [Planctomycetota bacterium]